MKSSLFHTIFLFIGISADDCVNKLKMQCDGIFFQGASCCPLEMSCIYRNSTFSQCEISLKQFSVITPPSKKPTNRPSMKPKTIKPTKSTSPTTSRSFKPSSRPTISPTSKLTVAPTCTLSAAPSKSSTLPSTTFKPIQSVLPSCLSSNSPKRNPSTSPSAKPSGQVTTGPSKSPTSKSPTFIPSFPSPSYLPSTVKPSPSPSLKPSGYFTSSPSKSPTSESPTFIPSFLSPSYLPTTVKSTSPSSKPLGHLTSSPSKSPSFSPTSKSPTFIPSFPPPSYLPSTVKPTSKPTIAPTSCPSSSQPKTKSPIKTPTSKPVLKSTLLPTVSPSFSPSFTTKKSVKPTRLPSTFVLPTKAPSQMPSASTNSLNYFSTKGNQIVDQQGRPVRISAVNWFGFETLAAIAGGLQQRGYKSILLQMKQLNFNAVRITFANEIFLFSSPPAAYINYYLNPDLQGLGPLECMDAIIQYCTAISLRVILSRRAALASNYYSEQLWYIPSDADFTQQKFETDWVMLANRYANSAVIGVDLWDEPKLAATWAAGDTSTDWNTAATSAGNAVLAVNPRWLIFVQGVGADTWWGGNLKGVAANPIVFNTPNQLVYAVSDFPLDIYPQLWLTDASFPSNMRPRWDAFWGYIFQQDIAPVMISSFGALLNTEQSRQWMQTVVNYADGQFTSDGLNELPAGKLGLSWAYSAVNADFPLLGGLLAVDWRSVNRNKLSYIDQSFGSPLDVTSQKFPTSAPLKYPTERPTPPVTLPPTPGVPVIQPRGTCVQEDFSSMNFQYFTAAGCQNEMSILPGGYLNLHISPSCSNTRIDSNQFYQNAYVETRFKIGGMGPDFSGVVYAFYTDGIVKPNGLHADEIDVEIVGNGNSGRGWALNTMQLGVWVPNYDFKQYLTNLGPYDMVNEFVTYAFQWNYDAIDFFINGQFVYSSSPFQTSMGYTQPQKVIFSLWDGTPFPDFSQRMNWNSPRVADFKMIIDYVKICT